MVKLARDLATNNKTLGDIVTDVVPNHNPIRNEHDDTKVVTVHNALSAGQQWSVDALGLCIRHANVIIKA